MEAFQRDQLNRLCSKSTTYQKAQSILRLASAKTGPGSGFVVKNPAAIPAVCAYLASEQQNTGEVSQKSAMSAACVSQAEFSDALKKLRAVLSTDEADTFVNVTYEMLVDAYRIQPRTDAIACMEGAEVALPNVHILKENHGKNVLTCAVFYWVCQLMEEPSVQQRALCHTHSINPRSFKPIVTLLDEHCDDIADQIKLCLLQKWRTVQASASSQPNHVFTPTSPSKSIKPALRPRINIKVSSPATTPSKKRTVAFTRLPPDSEGASDGGVSFPETPTKKRRIDTSSLDKPSTRSSPAKQSSSTGATAAFYAAIRGSPIKQLAGQESATPGASPSTPRRPRLAKVADVTTTPVHTNLQSSPSRSQGQTTPTRPPVRRRFRPVFLEQQQWCARDPKVERMWAVADTVLGEMVERYGHPFQRTGQRGMVIDVA